jgi:hypothetical protein
MTPIPERCTLLAEHGLPVVVAQALRDRRLAPVDRLAMWYLAELLDFVEHREVKGLVLGNLMGIKETSALRSLQALVHHGYLDLHPAPRRRGESRAYRLPWSKRQTHARAA